MRHFQREDRVAHAQLGAGIVVEADERYTVIAFDDGVVRKFVTRLVQLERSNLPLPPPPAPPRRRRPRASGAAASAAAQSGR